MIETQAILECLDRAVEKALDRKRRLGQYAVVWEDGQIKELRFDESDSKRTGTIGVTDSSGADESNQ